MDIHTEANVHLLMIAAHFPSIQYDQGDGQRKTAIELRHDVEHTEEAWNERHPSGPMLHTFIVGDLNASPFDAGIAAIYGLNATSSRSTVLEAGYRTLNDRTVRLLYNPMWRFLDATRSSGTYYRRLSNPISYDWFVLDQVLVSPSLVPHFRDDELRIVTWDAPAALGGRPLTDVNTRRPIASISDHLPILFRFDV